MAALEVNEARILATTQGVGWWLEFRHRFEPVGRIQVVTASMGGDLVRVKCDDKEHAAWLLETMVQHGIPKSAVKIARGENAT